MRASASGGKTICMVFEMRGVDSIVGDRPKLDFRKSIE